MVNVSVIMSIYNETKEQVNSAIDSILNQSFADFEFIIINDNPGNSTLSSTVRLKMLNDSRIKFYENEKNIGLAASLNKAMRFSNSDLIARMDADDISLPERLQIEVDFLQNNKNISLVSTNCFYINETGAVVGQKNKIPTTSSQIAKLLPYGSTMIHPSFMFRKSVIKKIGGYQEYPTAEDYDLLLRLIKKGYSLASIDQPLIKYRIRKNSMTQSDKFLLLLTTEYQRLKYREIHNQMIFEKKGFYDYLVNNKYFDKSKRKKNNQVLNELEQSIFRIKEKPQLVIKFLYFFITKKYCRIHSRNLLKYRLLKGKV